MIFVFISYILQFAGISNARKDPGVKKDEVAMPELVQSSLVDMSKVTSKEVDNCHDTSSFGSREFEPRPNISAYNDNSKEDTSFVKDFEPRPNISAYNDNSKLKEDKSFEKDDFEPRPNVSAYNEDEEKQSFVKDFEPRLSVTAYNEDEEKQSFTPRPNATAYNEDEEN